MGAIFQVNANDLQWTEYEPAGVGADGRARIRVKGLSRDVPDVPSMQYLEYAPGHSDSVHRHDTGEVFIVTEGDLWVDDVRNGPGSVVFIPRHTDYAVRGGDDGVRYFRVVVA